MHHIGGYQYVFHMTDGWRSFELLNGLTAGALILKLVHGRAYTIARHSIDMSARLVFWFGDFFVEMTDDDRVCNGNRSQSLIAHRTASLLEPYT